VSRIPMQPAAKPCAGGCATFNKGLQGKLLTSLVRGLNPRLTFFMRMEEVLYLLLYFFSKY
jgi:hypothetical protein